MTLFGLNAAVNEYFTLKRLEHSNILKARGYYEDTDYQIIVVELMASDLRDLV